MITEQLLLNHGNAKKIEEIQSLKLANLNLTSKDLSKAKELFEELTSLDELDLSGNNIHNMPSIPLHECRVLDLSYNNLQDIDFLEDAWTIEEIDLRGNGQIDIVERMKIRTFLPKIRMINLEPTEERDPAVTIARQLQTRLAKLFNESFKPQFDDLKSNCSLLEVLDEDNHKESEDYQILAQKFIEKAKKIPAGPGSVRKFRSWLAERMANEILEDDKMTKKEIEFSVYQKMKKKKKINSDPILENWECSYSPLFALQCHSDDAKNERTQIWNLAFEPFVGKNDITTSNFASAGGDSICFVDCKSGKVRSKYVREGEEFFSIAWSYFEADGSLSQRDTFVAIGGKSGFVYIVQPSAGSCLYKIKISKKWSVNVNTISFCNPVNPSLMFAGAAGTGVFEMTGWNITSTKATKLIHLDQLTSGPIRILIPNKNERLTDLLCATENGIQVWNIEDLDPNRKETRALKGKLCHPKIPENNQVDALTQLSSDVLVSRCSNSGVIFIWKHRDLLSELIGGQSAIIEPLKIFNWSNTDELYINVGVCVAQGKFLSGDEKGRIWIYKPDYDGPEMQIEREIIPWPKVIRENGLDDLKTTIVNDVIMSSDGRFIVAATNNNLLLILK